MQQLTEDLWQSKIYTSGILSSQGYYLTKNEGDFQIYHTADKNSLQTMEELGGIDYQLLTHRDEATSSLARIKEQFSRKLVCSQDEYEFRLQICRS